MQMQRKTISVSSTRLVRPDFVDAAIRSSLTLALYSSIGECCYTVADALRVPI